jgi:hypothetical protein
MLVLLGEQCDDFVAFFELSDFGADREDSPGAI